MTDRATRAESPVANGLVALGPRMRVDRDSPLIEMQGSLNEVNAWIGVIISLANSIDVRELMPFVQHDLRYLSDQIGLQSEVLLSHEHLVRIDSTIARLKPKDFSPEEETLPPSSSTAAAFAFVARSVCQRAERQLASLEAMNNTIGVAGIRMPANDLPLAYLKRLDALLRIVGNLEARQST